MLYLMISFLALALMVIIGVPYLIDMFKAMDAFKKFDGESIHDQLLDMMGFGRHSHG